MEINSVSSYMSENVTQSKGTQESKAKEAKEEAAVPKSTTSADAAVIVEKSEAKTKATYSKKSSKVDTATIQKLKRDADEKTMQLRSLVEKLLLKQSKTFDNSLDIYDIIKSGKLEVDDETRLQAQKDIADDGYWGVEQTSERLFSFATALAGNDPAQADKMVEAFKKGYAQAEKKWGGELPDICSRTYDAFLKKIDDWKQSKGTSETENEAE